MESSDVWRICYSWDLPPKLPLTHPITMGRADCERAFRMINTSLQHHNNWGDNCSQPRVKRGRLMVQWSALRLVGILRCEGLGYGNVDSGDPNLSNCWLRGTVDTGYCWQGAASNSDIWTATYLLKIDWLARGIGTREYSQPSWVTLHIAATHDVVADAAVKLSLYQRVPKSDHVYERVHTCTYQWVISMQLTQGTHEAIY